MNTIITYVNNIFSSLPVTPELAKAKEDITNNMIEKYQELKAEGHTENEAIGIVISEFGNIEELLHELGIDCGKEMQKQTISLDTIKEFLHIKNTTSILTTIGVALCIFGVLLNCLFNALVQQEIITHFLDSDGDSILGMVGLFTCVAIAVALFIYTGYLTKPYEFLKHGVLLDGSTKEYLMAKKDSEARGNTICIVIGVILCILCPITSTISEYALGKNNDLGDLPMLLLILVAVSLFVYAGCKSSVYDDLLKTPTHVSSNKKANILYAVVNSVIMLTATAFYLIAGLFFNWWSTSVFVFAIGGILCGISSIIIWGCTQSQHKHE